MISRARETGRAAIDEPSAKRALVAAGIRVPSGVEVSGPDEIESAVQGLAAPFALKAISPDIIHKSEAGAVALQLNDAPAIRSAMEQMTQRTQDAGHRLEGFLIEEMAPPGHAIVIGGVRDQSFGPVVMFGLGGIMVEVLRDVVFRICPITPIDAREMIAELRGSAILAGARGGMVIPEAVLVDTLLAVGGANGLLMSLPEDIAEVDINPLLVSATGAIAVDARFILAAERWRGA